MKEELLKGLTEEQIAKVKACKGQEEILAMAKEEGIELSDEQLEAVSGGNCTQMVACPDCGTMGEYHVHTDTGRAACKCPKCGWKFVN